MTFARVLRMARRVTTFLLALFFFVGALQLMKTGASNLDLFKAGGMLVRNPWSTLGLGWLGSLFVLSGSPIAASSLTLVASGSISEMQGFTMLTGSRLGAAFVVLLTAVIYALRGGKGKRGAPLSAAVITLFATGLIYVPAALIGMTILRSKSFHSMNLHPAVGFGDLIDFVYGRPLQLMAPFPAVATFLLGLAVLLVSFKVMDQALPAPDGRMLESSRGAWLTRKWPMFALGCLVALVTMSVSVALTVLVPVVANGYAKRQDIIPYVMGANITTLGDTMLAAFALGSPAAVRIVLAEVVATSLLSVCILAFFYAPVKRLVWSFQREVIKSHHRLATFTVALFLVPAAIIAVSSLTH